MLSRIDLKQIPSKSYSGSIMFTHLVGVGWCGYHLPGPLCPRAWIVELLTANGFFYVLLAG